MGQEEKAFTQDFDAQMKEWLKEEADITPALTEEQKKLLDSLPKWNMPDERLKELCRPWKDALIITLLGKNTNLRMMRDRIQWLLKTTKFELIDLPNNYYVFRTGDIELCKRLLFEGPWIIQGHYLAVQRWSPNFNPYCNKVRKVAIWIRVPTLPMHCYSEECMYELGNMIGRTLKVDMNTLAQCQNNTSVERGKFARVSVEIDLNKQLQSRVAIRSRIYPIEYEGLEIRCFKCGLYGHNQDECPLTAQTNSQVPETNSPDKGPTVEQTQSPATPQPEKHNLFSVPGVTTEEAYGNWMKAKKTFKPRTVRAEPDKKPQQKTQAEAKSTNKEQKSSSGSRYDALRNMDIPVKDSEKGGSYAAKVPGKRWKKKENKDTYPNVASEPGMSGQKVDGVEVKETDQPPSHSQ